MNGQWEFSIFMGTPDEVAEQVMNLISEATPRLFHSVDGEPLLMISTGSPVDGQIAVTVGAFLGPALDAVT